MTRRYDRRAFLRYASSASATAVAASLAGCTSGATSGDGGDGGSGGGGSSGGSGNDNDNGNGDGDNTVDMNDNLNFVPQKLTVSVGDTVTWKNVGRMPHSVTAYEGKIPDGADYFASGEFDTEEKARNAYPAKGKIPAEERYEHTFEVPGTYKYFCIPHEATNMIGTVEVTK